MATADILNFRKMLIWVLVTLIWPMSTYIPNFRQVSRVATEIWHKNTNPRWWLLPFLILSKVGYIGLW